MSNIARYIDHSLLRPDASEADIMQLCEEAKTFGFFAVCVQPHYVSVVKECLFKTHVKVVTVVGFPHGMTFPEVKIYEAMQAVLRGADELDIVMNGGMAKSGDWKALGREISDIVSATPEVLHKIIIESCNLTDEEKIEATLAVMDSGAEFIKTSTGFGRWGAEVKDIELIKSLTKGRIGIKASGGIRTLKEASRFIDAGATRIGTSSGVNIMKEAEPGSQVH